MVTRRKFDLKRFNEDREDSLERSKKGELKLIAPDKVDTIIGSVIDDIHARSHPLYDKANACPYKLALGCKLSRNRRTKPECEACI